jgi:septal ring factor EnvC (AmiA/AmiB activator)
MRRLPLPLVLCALSLPVFAGGAQGRAAHASDDHAAASRLDRQVAESKAEVAQLQQGVAQQESQSRQAAVRLQQQDGTIAELKRQLQALQARSPSAPAGH